MVRTFNLRDGLASNSVTGMTQTSDQLMWISTWNGLSIYDGYRFVNFRDHIDRRRVLTTNRLLNIEPSQTGNLWCITYDLNAYIFDRKHCEYVDISKLIRERFKQDFHTMRALPMSNGKTWLLNASPDGAIYIVDEHNYLSPKGITRYYEKERAQNGEKLNWVWEDRKQRQWIITNQRVLIHEGRYKSELPFVYITQVNEAVYLATADGKICRFVDKDETTVPINLPPSIHQIYQLLNDGDERLIAATDAGLYVYTPKTKTGKLFSSHPLVAVDVKLSQLMPDSKGRVWAATENDDILLFEPGKGTVALMNQPQLPALKQSSVIFFHEDKYHTVWMATKNGLFGYYDEQSGKIMSYPIRTSTVQPFIDKYFFDRQGHMWYSGEHNLTLVNFEYNHMQHVNGIQEVRSTMYDHTGKLWIGTMAGDVMVYNPDGSLDGCLGKEGRIQQTPTRFSSHIYCLTEDSQQRIWIGTKGDGLYCIPPSGPMKHYLHQSEDGSSLPSNQVYDVHEDHQHRIWVGTFEKGICLLQDDQFIHGDNLLKGYPISDFHKVRRITETKEGVVIVSASNGLVTFSEKFSQPQDIRFYAHKYVQGDSTSLLTSDVMQTFVASDGTVYVATVGGGVQQVLDDNLLKEHLRFRRLSDISDCGIVLNILEDSHKNLWFGCENSINVYDPKTRQLWRFGPGHIGENTEMTEAKSSHNPITGRMTVATNDGFVSFLPDRLKEDSFVPPLVFDGVLFHGDRETLKMLSNDSLDVPSNRRNLTIYFAALDYQDNYMIQYSYLLEGTDKNWNFIGTEHSISFNHLPHGHHRLLVRSTNSHGKWMDNARVLNIYVHPTFWETGWAKLLYLLLFLGLAAVAVWIYRLYTVNSMERQLNRMKTQFFTDVSHKLRTPLTLIGGPVTQVLSTEKLSQTATQHLEMVRRNAQRMLDLVNKMLKYSKEHHTYISDEEVPELRDAKLAVASEESNAEPKDEQSDSVRLLVVEDNKDLLDFLVSILEDEYVVTTAVNGRDGLEKVQTEQPDFILTDVMMPEMDGLEMVHRIKGNPEISHIPIVILSAKASIDDRIEGLKAGVNDYITKPFSATYLKQRMRNIIANRRLLQQNYLENIRTEAASGKSAEQKGIKETDDRQTLKLKSIKIVDSDKQMMEQLVAFIEDNLSNPDLMIEDLAKAVCLGRTAFFNKVKSLVGMSPVELLRQIRIQHAEEMVASSNEPFSQIAYAVGFSDSRYFGKCFKKQTGLTPSEYREHSKATEE